MTNTNRTITIDSNTSLTYSAYSLNIERGYEMDSRTIGQLIGGFAVKAIAVGLAIYVATTVGGYVYHVFTAVNVAMNTVGG